MKTFLTFLVLISLASCTMLEKTGIEKRLYRPGFYLPQASKQKVSYRRTNDSIAEIKKLNETKNISALAVPLQNPDTVAMSLPKELVQYSSGKTGVITKKITGTIKAKLVHKNTSHSFFSAGSSTCSVKKSMKKSLVEKITGKKDCGNGCIEIIMEIIIVILALGILALFPTLSITAAELIALAVLIVAAVLIFILLNN